MESSDGQRKTCFTAKEETRLAASDDNERSARSRVCAYSIFCKYDHRKSKAIAPSS